MSRKDTDAYIRPDRMDRFTWKADDFQIIHKPQETKQEHILNIYKDNGGKIDVIANCHGDVVFSNVARTEFEELTKHLIGMRVVGALSAGKDGLEIFYESDRDDSLYVLKTYHMLQKVVTIFGKVIINE